MNPTRDWLDQANKLIRQTLLDLRPQLLEAQGNIEHRLKDDKSVVTEMDLLVENTLREELAKLDASIAFSGEETGTDYTPQTHWLVDPIDGTEPFIRGLPFATNMIALIDNNEPVLSVIHNITSGDYYLAIKGGGATCNGHPIHVSDRPLERSFVSMSYNPRKDPRAIGLADRLRSELGAMNIMKVGASGFQNPAVACGATDGTFVIFSNSNPWDAAPGMLLISEAGGRVANIGSDTYDYRDPYVVAANPVIFDKLKAFLEESAKS
jgi:myo-inositol-1(or 4)-monophosphatase